MKETCLATLLPPLPPLPLLSMSCMATCLMSLGLPLTIRVEEFCLMMPLTPAARGLVPRLPCLCRA